MAATLDVNVNPGGAVAGAAVAESALDKLKLTAASTEKGLTSLGSTSNRLGTAFQILTASFAIGGILKAADAYTVVQNRLKLVTSSQLELADAYKRVFAIAQETGAPLEATAKFYSQLALNAKGLQLSQEKLITVTSTLNKIIALTGQSSASSEAALIQLQQAMGSGALRGDELRSIMEQLPLLAQIIADKLKIPVGALKTYGEQGKISAKIVSDALLASADDIDKAFAKMNFTFAQAFNVLYNGLINTLGAVNNATGAFSAMANAIAFVGKELPNIVTMLGLLAAGFAALKLAAFIQQMNMATVSLVTFSRGAVLTTGTLTGWGVLLQRVAAGFLAARTAMMTFLLSNPFTAIIVALGLVISFIYSFKTEVAAAGATTVTVGNVLASVWNGIVTVFAYVANLLVGTLAPAFYAVSAAVQIVVQVAYAVVQVFLAVSNTIFGAIEAFAGLTAGVISWSSVGSFVLSLVVEMAQGFRHPWSSSA
jgi:tape measure domain-containing protein